MTANERDLIVAVVHGCFSEGGDSNYYNEYMVLK